MSQAIITRRLPQTNTRGYRIQAKAYSGSITVAWNYDLDEHANHRAAAERLANNYSWLANGARLVSGTMPNDTGYAFVLINA